MTANVVSLPLPTDAKPSTAIADREFTFTKTEIAKRIENTPDAGVVEFRDAEVRGLILRRQTKDWVIGIKRKIGGKVRRATICRWTGREDLKAIRAKGEAIMSDMRAGTYQSEADLCRKRQASKTTALAKLTLSDAVELHVQVNPQLRPRSVESTRYAAGKFIDAIGKDPAMPLVDLDAVRTAYDQTLKATSPATAALMLRSLSAIWNTWAGEHPEGEEPLRNPFSSIKRKRGRVKAVKSRENALAVAERLPWIKAVEGMNNTAAHALAFIFWTGLRKREVFDLKWSEVDLNNDALCIEEDRMKGRVALERPVTPKIRAILEAQRHAHPASSWVFPAAKGDGHLIDARKTLRQANRASLTDGRSVTIHDLRRTYLAAAALAGVPEVGAKLLVGHSVADITQTYQKALRSELGVFADRIEAELCRDVQS